MARRSKVSLLLAAAVVATLSIAAPPLAHADPLAVQAKLVQVADEIEGDIRPAKIAGYSGLRLDTATATLHVYSSSDTDARVRSAISRKPTGIKVVVHDSRFSAASLEAARNRVVKQSIEGLHWISVRPEGDGLDIEVQVSAPVTEGELSTIAGVPVHMTRTATGPATASRQNDASPWSGGAMIFTPTGFTCSAGFGVRKGSTYYVATAAHCEAGYYLDGAGQSLGLAYAADRQATRDTMLIRVNSGTTSSNQYYDGSYTSNTKKVIAASGNSYAGLDICTSGANSGVHCSVRVVNANTSVDYGFGFIIAPVVQAKHLNNTTAVVGGDSGGPVVGPYLGGFTKMMAYGVISGGTSAFNPRVCPSTMYPPGNDQSGLPKCYETVFYAPINTLLSNHGATLNVG